MWGYYGMSFDIRYPLVSELKSATHFPSHQAIEENIKERNSGIPRTWVGRWVRANLQFERPHPGTCESFRVDINGMTRAQPRRSNIPIPIQRSSCHTSHVLP